MNRYPIPEAALSQHIIALGKTGAGKSSALRSIVEPMLEDKLPLCILDPKGDWWGLKLSKNGKHPAYPVLWFDGEGGDVRIDPKAGAAIGELAATRAEPMLVTMGSWGVGERSRFFLDFAQAYFKKIRGKHWLIIDEVHNFAPKGKVFDPDAGKMLNIANKLASEGRGKGINLIAASQRPQKVHNDFLTSCETLIAMKVIHKADRDAIADWIDGCGDKALGKQVLDSLAQQKRGTGWVWSPEIEFGPQQVEFPMFKTYDSFKPQETTIDMQVLRVEEINQLLASVIERADADNPAKLKQRIANLERLVKQLQQREIPDEEAENAIAAGKEAGYRDGHSTGWLEGYRAGHAGALVEVHLLAADFEKRLESIEPNPPPKVYTESRGVIKTKPSRVSSKPARVVKPVDASSPVIKREGELHVGPLQQQILDAIAWLNSMGIGSVPKPMLGAVVGKSYTSGYFTNTLGSMRKAAGLIDYRNSEVILTPTGEQLADRSAFNGATVPEQWLSFLSGLERDIVKHLLDVSGHEDIISKESLAKRLGKSATSGYFTNTLGHLRTLGAIDYPSKGMVTLTEHVLP